MTPKITNVFEKNLIGLSTKMSLSNNKTAELWQTLMPRRGEIKNRVDQLRYSMQIYDASIDFSSFTPATVFTKWAAFEVENFDDVPNEMKTHILGGGEYAVFLHQGPVTAFPKTWNYIFNTWLPNSDFELDNREHFEILRPSYQPFDPNAEEEVWIPIRS